MLSAGLAVAVIACTCLPAVGHAAPRASLSASLSPERLGHSTTIGFGFHITDVGGRVPPALTEVNLEFPAEMGIGTSGLGVETCERTMLEALGVEGCPPDSLMGFGTVVTEIPAAQMRLRENNRVVVVRGPTEGGHLSFFIQATGTSPVITDLTFPAVLVPARAPYGETLQAQIPLIPSFPDAADVAVVTMHATLGSPALRYEERTGGTVVSYHPAGVLLPAGCRPGGFRFAAKFGFADGSHALARTSVRCPTSG